MNPKENDNEIIELTPEAGKFEALVGNAADNLKLKKAFELF